MNTSIALDSSLSHPEDRGGIVYLPEGFCLAVADGAGGMSGGAEAAEMFLQTVGQLIPSVTSEHGCASLLTGIDNNILADPLAGETTGVVVVVKPEVIYGASVGDSAAWLFHEDDRHELTLGQVKKPFLGSGAVLPYSFSSHNPTGTLVVATDGLWKYTNIEAIHQAVLCSSADGDLAKRLAELARLKSGTLPDDVCIITCSFP